MYLTQYKKKRNFNQTSEPKGMRKESKTKNIYSIQEHRATHLHWDLRLEKDGVLKSWALPKEPSTDSKIRRLAVQTEDHPVDYAFFEGVIPKGQYGAGTIKLYDKGTYELIEFKPNERYVININGRKLKGLFVILKFKGEKNWLFFKKKRIKP